MTCPVIKLAPSEARKATTAATSAGSPILPSANAAPAAAPLLSRPAGPGRPTRLRLPTGSGTGTPAPARSQDDHPPGPETNDISQLLDAVALGNAVAGFVRAAVEVAASGDARTGARRDHRPEQVQHPRVSDAPPVRGQNDSPWRASLTSISRSPRTLAGEARTLPDERRGAQWAGDRGPARSF